MDHTWTHYLEDSGLLYLDPDYLTRDEASNAYRSLYLEIPWEQGKNRWGLEPRLSAWFADDARLAYHYSGSTRKPLPWPPTLELFRQRVQCTCAVEFNSCLANLYRTGADSMGYHADDEPELGSNPTIASLSLGSPRGFLLRHQTRGLTLRFTLGDGCLLVMSGTTQTYWKHAVPKTRKHVGPRMNLTFRRIESISVPRKERADHEVRS